MWGWVGGVEKWRLKLTSAKVKVEVEAELGNKSPKSFQAEHFRLKSCYEFKTDKDPKNKLQTRLKWLMGGV